MSNSRELKLSHIIEKKAGNYKIFFIKFHQNLKQVSSLKMVLFFFRSVYSVLPSFEYFPIPNNRVFDKISWYWDKTLGTKHTIIHNPYLFLFRLQSTTSASDGAFIDSFVIFKSGIFVILI